MTKAKRCDLLLCAAKHWQSYGGRASCCLGSEDAYVVLRTSYGLSRMASRQLRFAASMALSEAAGLGFELENADDTPTEKVAVVASVAMACLGRLDRQVTYKLRTVKP